MELDGKEIKENEQLTDVQLTEHPLIVRFL